MEPTPLCGLKIVAILTVRITLRAFPTYQCGAAQRQAVSPLYRRENTYEIKRFEKTRARQGSFA
jgi:hypothetical protein